LRIFGHQLTQLIGEQSAHTASAARRNSTCFFEQPGLDRECDVVLNRHGLSLHWYLSSRKLREDCPRVKAIAFGLTGKTKGKDYQSATATLT
jgi:hypothetical protein